MQTGHSDIKKYLKRRTWEKGRFIACTGDGGPGQEDCRVGVGLLQSHMSGGRVAAAVLCSWSHRTRLDFVDRSF